MGNFNRDRGGRGDRRGGGGFGGRRDGGRGFGGGNRDGGRPSMHKAICDACHKECEVPFRPSSGKPIFCSDCFEKQGGGGGRDRDRSFGDRKPRFEGGGNSSSNSDSKDILKGIKTLNYKIDELIKILATNPEPSKKSTDSTVEVKIEKTPAAPKNKKKAAAKKVAKKKAAPKKESKKKKAAKK